MKKNVIGVFFVISMLMCTPIGAEGEDAGVSTSASVDATAQDVVDVPTGGDTGSDVVDASTDDDAAVTDPATGGFLTTVKEWVVWPWDFAVDQATDKRPFASGVVLTAGAFAVMYKLCPWFREDVLGCAKKRKDIDEDLF